MKKYKIFMLTAIFSIMAGSSALAGEWKQDDAGWWYDNGDTTYENTGWSWIGERWYYFTQEGDCLLNTTTPDGFQVDEHGAWIIDGVIQTKGSDVAIISPVLNFVTPKGFEFYSKNKSKNKIPYYKAPGATITEFDYNYEDKIRKIREEQNGVHINLDYVMSGREQSYNRKIPCQLKSGEWVRYDYQYPKSIGGASEVKYVRLIGDHLHMVTFTGVLNGIETDAIMDTCVR